MYALTTASADTGPPFKTSVVNNCLEFLTPFWYPAILNLKLLSGFIGIALAPINPNASLPNS